MIEVGMGHKIPALAIKEELERKYPDSFDISVLDFPKECGATLEDFQLKTGWDVALTFPFSARIGYRLIEWNKNNFFYIEILYRNFIKKGMRYIANAQPDLIVATHPLCLYVACKARRHGAAHFAALCCVVDPFDGYSLWANPDADLFLVATEQSKARLIAHGINPSRIEVTGFPIRRSFLDIKNWIATNSRLHLELILLYPLSLSQVALEASRTLMPSLRTQKGKESLLISLPLQGKMSGSNIGSI